MGQACASTAAAASVSGNRVASANSIFCGDKLLTTGNPTAKADRALIKRLGMAASAA